ncbi:very-short-patch-repair endonuclease [Ensifer sp. WSM1721]
MPHADVSPKARGNARRMRSDMTEAEVKLWNELRADRLMGLGFRRQVPIAGYIVDFACAAHRLVVEVDGSQHARSGDLDYDRQRTERLASDGWTVLRFWNDDVLRDIDDVCEHIVRVVGKGGARMMHSWLTPLCPAGHLPHKGGDRQVAMSRSTNFLSLGWMVSDRPTFMLRRAVLPATLPPCGGDARQGRGGCGAADTQRRGAYGLP